ncbi:hypothetical protein [Candidatus Phytoplasma meliae]|uniref:Uncharacterized protein n=1 Tax=Candidatus Phytoplasma meliae TaxID=1848402 RepID=A0ABS5CYF8_9MOLU|nr:hypothetical protein [Candidatus Phytoplasma meliae]MBP5836011.1 hypothetical protein [Candidatus Phytoplasma meliae]
MNNNNFKKSQNFKKGGQYFLSILSLFLLFAINYHFLSATTNEQEKELFDISSINPKLGLFENIPTIKDICERIKELNKEASFDKKNFVKDSEISFKILNETSLDYECEGLIQAQENATKFKGQIKVYFQVKQDLNNIIKNTDLREIRLTKLKTQETIKELLPQVIIDKNPNLKLSDFEELNLKIQNNNSDSIVITVKPSSKSLKYKGKVTLHGSIKTINKQVLEQIKGEYQLEDHPQINYKQIYKHMEKTINKELKKDPNNIKSALQKVKEKTDKELQKVSPNPKNEELDAPDALDVNDEIVHISDKDTDTEPKEIVKLNSKVADHQSQSFWQEHSYLIYIVITSIAIVLLIVLVIFLSSFKKRDNLQ